MKTILLRSVVLSCVFSLVFCISLKAQYVAIPDSGFAAWLHANGWDSCMIGNTLDTSRSLIYQYPSNTLPLSNLGLTDLTGLKYIRWKHHSWFGSARAIDLSHNNFIAFPNGLLDKIYNLSVDLSYNHIDTFIYNSDYFFMQALYLSHNGLRYFGGGGTNSEIDTLDLNYNELDTFPLFTPYPECALFIRGNHLTQFPRGNFYTVDCGNNQISSIPLGGFIKYVKNLVIDSNLFSGNLDLAGLTEGSGAGNYVQKIDCSHNAITGFSNIRFEYFGWSGRDGVFICNDNNLTGSLPKLPPGLQVLDCHNNPNLQCIYNFSAVPTLQLNFSNTDIQCLPFQYPTCVYTSTPAINSVPVCDIFTNVHQCNIFSIIAGNVYSDLDSNCIDSLDFRPDGIKVNLIKNGVVNHQTYTSGGGHYYFDQLNMGTYIVEIDTTALPYNIVCPDPAYYTAVANSQFISYDSLNFGIDCKPGFDLAAWSIEGRFRPAGLRKVDIHVGTRSSFNNMNCGSGISGTVTTVISGPASYIAPANGALTPDNVSGSVLTYYVPDFGNTDFNNSFNIMVLTDTTAQIGDTICITVTVTPVTGDDFPTNNIQTHCFTVVGSFDPNDKQVYPFGNTDTSQHLLTYTIRFQNTGTAETQHIYVTDTLDSDLDVSSFQLLAYSHLPIVQIKENAVRFNFPNINLPDSNTNEPLSHGYVQYKIKLKDNLPIGTEINNTAFIYFDFNEAVVTNTTSNTIAVISSNRAISYEPLAVRIYPNPASDVVTISVDEGMIGSVATVTDIMGRKMSAVQLQTLNTKLETQSFDNGVYFVTVTDKKGINATKKLMVNH